MRGVVLCLLFLPMPSMAVCTLATTNFSFGVYAPASALPLDASSNIAVSCDGVAGQVVSYTLAINSGGSGSFVSRQMRYAAYSISYNLYLDAARTMVWGDGNTGTNFLTGSYAATAGMNVRNYPLYGRISAGQAVPAGNYSDALVSTLTY